MNNLKRICEESIEAGEKAATKRPWGLSYDKCESLAGTLRWIADLQCSKDDTPLIESDGAYIVLSANHADKLASALLVMDETLGNILNYLHHNTDNLCGDDLVGDKRLTKSFEQRVSEIYKAFAQVEEILK